MGRLSEYLEWLGMRVEDKVTGFAGVVTSVSFDLFGCIQVVVSPPADNVTHKLEGGGWFDVSRLRLVRELGQDDSERVMPVPDFERTQTADGVASGDHGPADKPQRGW